MTAGTSAGLAAVLAGLDLGPGDELITSENEHPGLIGPLIAARQRGATVRAVPFAQLAEAVDSRTTLVAASHVNWITGEIAPAELAGVGVPVILDGAQGAGAVPVDVRALGCAAYAAAGQKWLCGADGTGMLYLEPEFGARVRTIAPGYFSFEDASRGLESVLRTTGAPLRRAALARERGVLTRRAAGARGGGSRTRSSSAPRTWPTASPPRSPTPATPSLRAGAARSSPSSTRTRRPRASGSPRPASPSATCPATRTCARRSAPGTTSPTSSACSPRCERGLRLLRLELRRRRRLPEGDADARADARRARHPGRLRRRVRRPDGRARRHHARSRRRGRRRDPAGARGPRDRAPRPDRAARRAARCTSARR